MTQEITRDSVLRRSTVVLSSDLGEETVMMDIDKGVYYGLDAVGARLWALLEQPASVAQLCRALAEEFDVTLEHCQGEVLPFLGELSERGLVEIVEPTTP